MLIVKDLKKTFYPGSVNERVALDGLSLTLNDGDFAVIIGGNGAGKSTFLNTIAGEIIVDEGFVEIDGRTVTKTPTHKRTHLVSRVFQDPMAGTSASMTIEENLALAARRGKSDRLKFASTSARRKQFRDLLARIGLGLEDRLDHGVGLLSGGQRQSLSLVMATITTPHVLLLDEHTAALDPKTAEMVMNATLDAIERDKLTAVMVTHNMQHAIDFGNRLVMMMAGKVVYEASGAEKAGLSVEKLIERFHIVDDKMLLA